MSVARINGFADMFEPESSVFTMMEEHCRAIFPTYGFHEVRIPILEYTDLFCRSIGQETDVVQKEMYTFPDGKGRLTSLRPEATAGIMRAYIAASLNSKEQVSRLYTFGPMFRHERPQKGRMRQFHQIDCELLGSASPLADADVISLLEQFITSLGIGRLTLRLNSLGCSECRPKYREALIAYLEKHESELCEDCQRRLHTNPLRVLDCKEDREIVAGAPDIFDSLCDECAEHFKTVTAALTRLGVKYTLDKTLVRGLDYYTKTAFEVKSGDLGAQSAVCGGGRYDNLAEAIGGPHVPGVGFAAGLDRVILVMGEQGCSFGAEPALDAYVVCPDETARLDAVELLYALRRAGLKADMDYAGRGMKGQMKTAVASGAKAACILGGDELARGVAAVRDLSAAVQEEVPLADVPARVASLAGTR